VACLKKNALVATRLCKHRLCKVEYLYVCE
jgi:hypothetical protein